MPRVRKGAARSRKHKKVLKSTRGYIGALSRRYRAAKEAAMRAGAYATVGRRRKKRDFRRLWITRISAACRMRDVTYSRFIAGLIKAGVTVNRKVMADLAVSDPPAFDALVSLAFDKAAPAPKAEAKPAAEAPKAEPAKKKAAAEDADAKPAKKKKPAAKAEAEDADAKPAAKKKTAAKKKAAAKKKPAPEKDAE